MRRKIIIATIPLLMMQFASFSQVRLNVPVSDTIMHTEPAFFTYSPNAPAFTFQDKQIISPGFYAGHLSFFCRQELKLQQVHVPLTFRVGTMDQCNYLEQKPGYR